MKKRIVMLLCVVVLALGFAAVPAMASDGPYSPIEVETYTYGPFDEPRVNKVYRLPADADPSGIPTEDFERGGRRYYLLDMMVANTDHETVTYTAVFGSEKIAKTEPQAMSGTPWFPPFDTGFAEKGADPDLLPLLVCVGCMAIAVAIKLCSIKSNRKGESK